MATGTNDRIALDCSPLTGKFLHSGGTSWRNRVFRCEQTRMLATVNTAAAETLAVLSRCKRIGSLGLEFSRGGTKPGSCEGAIRIRWGEAEWDNAILQGPHLHIATPLYKAPNPTMKHNQDWTSIDFETLAPGALPITAYKPTGDPRTYDGDVYALGTRQEDVATPPEITTASLGDDGRKYRGADPDTRIHSPRTRHM